MALISANVNWITNKMVWNAHYRVVHLLANDGKDGAPFLDVHAINPNASEDFGPGSTTLIARKMNESWHRADPKPTMVRLSTKEYPIGYHSRPLEDIDDVAGMLFNKETIGTVLSTGRATKLATTRKRKGCDMPGAAVREERHIAPHSDWLPFPNFGTLNNPILNPQAQSDDVNMLEPAAPSEPSQLGNAHILHGSVEYATQSTGSLVQGSASKNSPTQLEKLFVRHGARVLNSDHSESSTCSNSNEIQKVPSWRMRLINDHKRRLTERWGIPSQVLTMALPGIEQVIANALAMGIHPTAPDHRERVEIIASHKKRAVEANIRPQIDVPSAPSSDSATSGPRTHYEEELRDFISKAPTKTTTITPTSSISVKSPKKRSRADVPGSKETSKLVGAQSASKQKKVVVSSSKQSTNCRDSQAPGGSSSSLTHPNRSGTLEPDQDLPPDAYFVPISIDEKPAWRCGIKHAMGHYYNAGDRKSCRGCNTSLSDNMKMQLMDFYLPPRSFFHQPSPSVRWKPCKASGKARKSGHPCHNSVAKDAYWAAMNAGATETAAQKAGVEAVEEYIRPKPPKETTPQPTPESEPDLGPHPSGSTTMEHGQDVPECAYWETRERYEEPAWRCDVSHALGRYYLAGDKKSCLGCGTNKGGQGRQATMDFYLPPGVILRQDVDGQVKWKPRKYKPRAASSAKPTRAKYMTHNQICAEKYFEALGEGCVAEQAMRVAIERTDAFLDGKQAEAARRYENNEDDGDEEADAANVVATPVPAIPDQRNDSANASRRNSRGGYTSALVPRKQDASELSDDEMEEVEEYDSDKVMQDVIDGSGAEEVSSEEEESSGSDSE